MLFPSENEPELQDIPFSIRDAIRLTPVSSVEDVLRAALLRRHEACPIS